MIVYVYSKVGRLTGIYEVPELLQFSLRVIHENVNRSIRSSISSEIKSRYKLLKNTNICRSQTGNCIPEAVWLSRSLVSFQEYMIKYFVTNSRLDKKYGIKDAHKGLYKYCIHSAPTPDLAVETFMCILGKSNTVRVISVEVVTEKLREEMKEYMGKLF